MNKLSEEAVGRILAGIKDRVTAAKDNSKWIKLFVDAGDFCVGGREKADEFYTDLAAIFSERNMKEMAESLKGKSGFRLRELLEEKLQRLMADYEIDLDVAETYTNHFMQMVLAYLETNMPEEYTKDFLKEWKGEEEEQFRVLSERLKRMEEAVRKLGKGKKTVFTIAEMNAKLRKETISPRIGLEFFEIDDEEFLHAFHKQIAEKRLYIVGKSREETIYCILNEIRKMKQERIVLVVTDAAQWEQLERDGIKDAILIPWFYAGTIAAIENNTNIFVYGEDEPCYVQERITLRRRTRQNLVHSLEKAGMDSEKASAMAESTHGLYVPLKKKMYNGAFYGEPAWKGKNKKVFVTALLCGKWTESGGDKLIIEELSGMSYEAFMAELSPFMRGGNPFAVEVQAFEGRSIQITCVEQAWEELDAEITEDIWDKFVELFYEVLVESEPIFEFPFEKHFAASIYAEKPYWSPALKRGMIRTLTMRAYYRGHKENQSQVNAVVKKVLDTVTDCKRWGYIAQYFTDLCEAAPEIVLQHLEAELQYPTGMEEMFAAKDGDAMSGRHYYTHILWAVEELLLQRQYADRAARWLWQMDAKNIQYSITNSPRSILETILCAWINVCVLSAEQKAGLADWALERFDNAWDIIYSELPGRRNTLCSTLNHPRYRTVDEVPELYNRDVNATYLSYVRGCLGHMDASPDKWEKMIETTDCFYDDLIDEVFGQLTDELSRMDDEGRIRIKNKLRKEIYRHRYFKSAEWAMPESRIGKYEEMMNRIHTTDPVYEYLYLFTSVHDFPLQNPVPFDSIKKNRTEREENEKMRQQEIEQGIARFEERGLSLERLLQLAAGMQNSTLGESIAQYYGDRKYHEDILNLMLDLQDHDETAYRYVRYFIVHDELELKKIIAYIRDKENKVDFLIRLLELDVIGVDQEPLIASQDEAIQRKFWSESLRISVKEDAKAYLWALAECRRYGIVRTYLELLFDAKDLLEPDALYDWFVQIPDVSLGDHKVMDTMMEYHLEGVLECLQERYMQDEEKCAQIAGIEWLFGACLHWEQMRCVGTIMKKSPLMYAQMAEIIYLKDGEKKGESDEAKQKMVTQFFDIFQKAHFCPAEKDGLVEYESLRKWAAELWELLEKQKQSRLFGHLIGRLLPYAPDEPDGTKPCKAVRKLIEDIYDDSLKKSYITAEINKRGVYTPDAGKTETEKANFYQENADRIRSEHYHTAMIYDALSEEYRAEAAYERKSAEDEW